MAKVFNPENSHLLDSKSRLEELPPENVLEFMEVKKGDILVDVGAGTGYFSIPALKYVGKDGKVFAVDISEKMINIIKNKIKGKDNIKLILSKTYKINLPSKIADKILLAFVVHEVEDKKLFLKEIDRLLKEEGTLAIVEWEKKETDRGPPLSERLDKKDLIDLMSEFNYKMLKYKKLNNYNYICLFEKMKISYKS